MTPEAIHDEQHERLKELVGFDTEVMSKQLAEIQRLRTALELVRDAKPERVRGIAVTALAIKAG